MVDFCVNVFSLSEAIQQSMGWEALNLCFCHVFSINEWKTIITKYENGSNKILKIKINSSDWCYFYDRPYF